MCTLTFAWQVFPDAPLVVAANRDERVDRPSTGPQREAGPPAVVAPRDEEAGGTWIGYNEYGLFAGITNRWTDEDVAGERSRGLLMRDVLAAESAEAATRLVERELDERTYAGFNLVLADGFAGLDAVPEGLTGPLPRDRGDPAAATLIEHGDGRRTTTLEPGVHVVVNVGADGRYSIPRSDPYATAGEEQAANADRLGTVLTPEPGETGIEWRDRAAATISDHEYGVCIHRDGFGTRSSSLLSFGEGGVRYQFAAGPPCETPYEDVSVSI